MASALGRIGGPALGIVAILRRGGAVAELVLQLACLSPSLRMIVTGTGPQPLIPDQRLGCAGTPGVPITTSGATGTRPPAPADGR